tara:strand:+ start:39 stop:983 length:945 start_codon:yes stop_codon:yes gene_type:complete
MKKKKRQINIAIILGFYNGNKYISEQVESIICQTHKNFKLFIFDDNSNEKINNSNINFLKNKYSNITIIKRKVNLGFAKNFLQGLKDVGSNFDYYAFSDQDDIWEKNKLEISLAKILKQNLSNSVLYSSRTAYYSSNCSKEISSSKVFKRKLNFKNSLIQNIAGGNTILMNKKARNLVVNSLNSDNYISHDWWCYQIISAAGGEIIFNPDKTVKYRQHDNNIIGGNQGFKEIFKRLNKFFSGKFSEWSELNIKNLNRNKDLFKKNNLKTLKYFQKARESRNILKKLIFYLKSGVFRQSRIESLIFFIGVIFNKI